MQQRSAGSEKKPLVGDVEVAPEHLCEAGGRVAGAGERFVDPFEEEGDSFAQVPEHDLKVGVVVEDAAQDQADSLRSRLHSEAPAGADEGRVRLVVRRVVAFGDDLVGQAGVQVDGHLQPFGAGEDRPEFGAVDEVAVAEAVDECAFEPTLLDGALELVGRGLGQDGREHGEASEAVWALGHDVGERVVHRAASVDGDVGGEALAAGGLVREDLHVDSGRIHLGDPGVREVEEAVADAAGWLATMWPRCRASVSCMKCSSIAMTRCP